MFFIRKKYLIKSSKSKEELFRRNKSFFNLERFYGKITETENGCDINLTVRFNYVFASILTAFLAFDLLFLFLGIVLLIMGDLDGLSLLGFSVGMASILSIICIVGFFASLKEVELIKNILTV